MSATGRSKGAGELSDLGSAVRDVAAFAPAEEMVADADLVVVEAGDDGELGRFVVQRIRAHTPRFPVVLAVSASQLARVDPAWGHDEFIVLPYVPHELVARLRAAEWRTSDFAQPELIKIGPLVIDLAAHEVRIGGTRVSLANREFELLVYLARARGRVRRREQILASVWKVRVPGAGRSLDVHVRRLRSKLAGAVNIETVRGVGYKLEG